MRGARRAENNEMTNVTSRPQNKAFGGLLPVLCTTLALGALLAPAAQAQDVCDGVEACDAPESICDPSGFTIELTEFVPAETSITSEAEYTYTICAPAMNGTCENDPLTACADHQDCENHGGGLCIGPEDPQCRVDFFQDLSHINVYFPDLGGVDSCLTEETDVTVLCSRGEPDTGDGSCADSNSPVAKCDSTDLKVGECMTMTVKITGELTGPGLGAAVTETKAPECLKSCIAGPSCDACDEPPPDGEECLTRTRGFWGTHPHIAGQFLDVEVCGVVQTTTDADECGTSEALCYNNSDRRPANPQSLELVAQLTAAKLNLNATLDLFGTTCDSFEYDGMSIQDWIDECEADFCDGTKKQISESGCIEALDAFNNSQDTGFDQTPDPFDHPGPAQVGECQEARGNGISNYSCDQP
jgi:hypothetical protein